MAQTIATITGAKAHKKYGNKFRTVRQVTFDSYVTGGNPVTAAQVGLNRIQYASAPVLIAGVASGYAQCTPLVQTDGSVLLKLYAAAGTESASGAGSAAVVGIFEFIGY